MDVIDRAKYAGRFQVSRDRVQIKEADWKGYLSYRAITLLPENVPSDTSTGHSSLSKLDIACLDHLAPGETFYEITELSVTGGRENEHCAKLYEMFINTVHPTNVIVMAVSIDEEAPDIFDVMGARSLKEYLKRITPFWNNLGFTEVRSIAGYRNRHTKIMVWPKEKAESMCESTPPEDSQ